MFILIETNFKLTSKVNDATNNYDITAVEKCFPTKNEIRFTRHDTKFG